jgi:tRNA (cytidine32/uridine32-2'-O)-methyltransferase
VSSLDEALGDCSFVVGASAKDKRIPWPVLDARRAAVEIGAASRQGEVAVVFGREDNGLSNEELMRCNLHLAIPTSDAYSSLNLAMAVQVVSYELHMLSAAPACRLSPTGTGMRHRRRRKTWSVSSRISNRPSARSVF